MYILDFSCVIGAVESRYLCRWSSCGNVTVQKKVSFALFLRKCTCCSVSPVGLARFPFGFRGL